MAVERTNSAHLRRERIRRAACARACEAHTLFIGPPRKLGGPLLEVMVEMIEPRTMVDFHVMEARRKFLDRMND